MAYRSMLRDRVMRHDLSLLSYCITSNHVHLLLRPDPGRSDALDTLSRFLQSLEGDFSLAYNRRKKRQNAFWGDRYHATMIDSGAYLWRCLVYIDLNMVRAGVVKHPRDWEWTAYQELAGLRERYRVLDLPVLLEQLGARSVSAFRENYQHCIEEALGQEQARDAKWTESLAVGSEEFVGRVGGLVRNRMKLELVEDRRDKATWLVRELSPSAPYGSFRAMESESKDRIAAIPVGKSLML